MKLMVFVAMISMLGLLTLLVSAQTSRTVMDSIDAAQKNVFVDADAPVGSQPPVALSLPNGEQYAKTKDGWIDIRLLEVQYYGAPGHSLSAGYVEETETGTIFYRWKDVRIASEQAPPTGPFHNTRVMEEKSKLKIVDVEPPIQFLLEGPSGTVTPGYLDPLNHFFYAFANVAVPLDQVPPKSSQHRSPLVLLRGKDSVAKRIIPIPDHLKKLLVPWTRKAAVTQPATAPSSQAKRQ